MANWNTTNLTCNDLQRFTEIMKTEPFKSPHSQCSYSYESIKMDEYGNVYMESKSSIPIKEIKKMSKENPDLLFKANIQFESERFDRLHKLTFEKGKEIGKKYIIEPCYCVIYKDERNHPENKYKPIMGDSYDKLYNEAIEIFKRIDIIKKDEEGNLFIDSKDHITLIIQDEKYQMKIKKGVLYSPFDLQIKCFTIKGNPLITNKQLTKNRIKQNIKSWAKIDEPKLPF